MAVLWTLALSGVGLIPFAQRCFSNALYAATNALPVEFAAHTCLVY